MNRLASNFTDNSKYNSLTIPVQLISIKTDIAKLRKMPRVSQGRLIKAYKELQMNTKLEPTVMRKNNGSGEIDLNKLFKNLIELGEIFKEYKKTKTNEKGVWNITNKKKILIDQIFNKIKRTLINIRKELSDEKIKRKQEANAELYTSQFPEEPHNTNFMGKYLQRRLNNLTYQPNGNGHQGGSLFVNVKGVGKRKVRYYKNGNKYVLVKGRKLKI